MACSSLAARKRLLQMSPRLRGPLQPPGRDAQQRLCRGPFNPLPDFLENRAALVQAFAGLSVGPLGQRDVAQQQAEQSDPARQARLPAQRQAILSPLARCPVPAQVHVGYPQRQAHQV